MNQKILVVGGSGTLGSLVAARLLTQGHSVRVMTREPSKAARLRAAGAEVVQGDLLNRESLASACAGADVLVAAAHSILGRGRNASVHVDGTAHRLLIDVAKERRLRHVVYTSAYSPSATYRSVPFFRIKHEVERHLEKSGLSYTILRPTAFMDFHAHVLIGHPILTTGKVSIFGRGEQPRNFVAAEDVARMVVRAIHDSTLAGETIDIGGPEDLTSMDVVRVYERAAGRHANVTHVPLAVARVMSSLARPVHPGLSQVLRMAILAETVAQRFDATSLLARFPLQLTRLEDWVSRRVREA
jgi:uncharacterized protein YbjT (DUF2867 family)